VEEVQAPLQQDVAQWERPLQPGELLRARRAQVLPPSKRVLAQQGPRRLARQGEESAA
jgi:hypothetical protein